MKDIFIKNIIEKNLIEEKDTVIVGVSGGYDSIVLLDLLLEAKKQINFDLIVCHVNHMLREEADFDEAFVKNLAESYRLTFKSIKRDMRKLAKEESLSEEEAGRKIRYQFFESLAKDYQAPKIATAHNSDDQVETFLMNLLRGSSLTGLTGMEEKKGNRIKPLLMFSREEIVKYASEKGLSHVEDKTNSQTNYRRNSIRLELIPYLEKKYNPNIKKTLSRSVELLKGDFEINKAFIDEKYTDLVVEKEKRIEIFQDLLKNEKKALRFSLYRKIIEKLLGSLDGFELSHIEEFDSLLEKETGREKIIKNIHLVTSYGRLIFTRENKEKKDKKITLNPLKEGIYYFNDYEIKLDSVLKVDRKDFKNPMVEYFALPPDVNLTVRSREKGDRIRLIGLKGDKKVKNLLIDEKIPKIDRDLLPIFEIEGEIIWVGGIRRSSLYKVSDKKCTRIEIRRIK